MKTVFISVFQSFISRNILNTGVLDEILLDKTRVILFVPSVKKNFYESTYRSENVFVESFDVSNFGSMKEKFFGAVAELLIDTNVMKHRKIKRLNNSGNYFKYIYQTFFTKLLGKSIVIKKIFRFLDFKFNNPKSFDIFIKKYNPDVVFSTDVFTNGDVMMMKSSLGNNIRTVGMVASWDNNTTKGLMRVIPDKLIVQNEIIKEESISIQSVPEKIIGIVGIAHYDYYKGHKPVSREEYFKRIGADPLKRIILFSPAGDKFISTDWQICEILKTAYRENKIPKDTFILVRNHPANPTNLSKFNPDDNFLIEIPGVSFDGAGDKRNELDKTALHHLLDTLYHCDLVINVVSSLVIDASIFDKPIITIGFDGWEDSVSFGNSVGRYLKDENMSKLLDISGTKVVKNAEELILWINKYLADSSVDKDGRERIVERQCWKLDGGAKHRIAEIVLDK